LGVGRGDNNPTPEKLNVKKPEAMPAGMARHSKGGKGLKQAVVPQKKKEKL
jgi:hypothetical protein